MRDEDHRRFSDALQDIADRVKVLTGQECLILWGFTEDDDECVVGMNRTEGLKFGDACRIAVSGAGIVHNCYGEASDYDDCNGLEYG